MTQLSLLDPTARVTDPGTSHRAALQARTTAPTHRQLALDTLRRCGPLTDFELAAITGIQQTSIGCRRKELVRLGLVEDSGLRRPSPSGSPAIVWRVVAFTEARGLQ